jgi:hypothetical protein
MFYYLNVTLTFPGTSVEFDPHTDGSGVGAVGDESESSRNDWWIHRT